MPLRAAPARRPRDAPIPDRLGYIDPMPPTISPLRRMVAVLGACLAASLASCTPGPYRNSLNHEQLMEATREFDAESLAASQRVFQSILRRMEHEADAHAADSSSPEPTIDILSISGGGDFGVFGAAFLESWGKLPADHPVARPHFDVVGGISTGALIAPFAFMGTEESLNQAVQTYVTAKPDWVTFRGLLSLFPQNAALFDMTKLEKAIRERVTLDLITEIASDANEHRVLLAGSTDLDLARMKVWNMSSEARRAVKEKSAARFQEILLSSAAIPIAFPARSIDGKAYADGGVVGNVLMGRDPEWVVKLAEVWKSRRPGAAMPKVRMWVLVNNKARLDPQFIECNWMPVGARCVAASTHASTVAALQQMYLRYKLAAVETGIQAEFRWVAIPEAFEIPHSDRMFDPKVTGPLAELGTKMGATPETSWLTKPPTSD